MTPQGAVRSAIDHVDVTFDTPIKRSTFTTEDVAVTGPGGPVSVTDVALVTGNEYRIAIVS